MKTKVKTIDIHARDMSQYYSDILFEPGIYHDESTGNRFKLIGIGFLNSHAYVEIRPTSHYWVKRGGGRCGIPVEDFLDFANGFERVQTVKQANNNMKTRK